MWAAWGWGSRPPVVVSAPPLLEPRCLAQVLATGFHRFLARFSGRRRSKNLCIHKSSPPWTILVLLVVFSLFSIVDACSSRTTPKPRPPAPTPRPNITFPTYECPPAYAAWFCLNGATCFTIKIASSLMYNCECAAGFMGPRCEYKDLDGSYATAQNRLLLETASIAGGATIAVFLVVILCAVVYIHYKRRAKASIMSTDCVDGRSSALQSHHRIFGTRWRNTTERHADLPIGIPVHERGDAKQIQQSRVELQQVTTLLPTPNQP